MIVCDRHKDRRSAYTIAFGVQETVDLCNECATEVREWVANTDQKLYTVPVQKSEEQTPGPKPVKRRGKQ